MNTLEEYQPALFALYHSMLNQNRQMQEERMDDNSHELQQLLEIIARIAVGDYSNDIMGLTTDTTPEPIRTIAEAMGLMMVKVEAREFHLEQLVAELQRLNTQIKHNTVQTVAAMAQALEARDSYTCGHAERVAEIAAQIALEMGFDEKRVELVRTAGVLHDIGKIAAQTGSFRIIAPKCTRTWLRRFSVIPAWGRRFSAVLSFLMR